MSFNNDCLNFVVGGSEKKKIEFDEEKFVYIDVPYEDKDKVKATKKAWFDYDNKKWFVLKTNEELINKYPIREKKYIFVPFEKRDEAKANGAKWDSDVKKWYVYDCLNE